MLDCSYSKEAVTAGPARAIRQLETATGMEDAIEYEYRCAEYEYEWKREDE